MLSSHMRCAPLFACLPLLISHSKAAEMNPSTQSMKETLHAVVRQQLEAFRRSDFPAAYSFAAAGIKDQFPLAEFESMVRKGYPLIATSTDAVFGLTLDDGDRAVVNVRIIGKQKQSANFQYLLERNGKDWRIAGVFEQEEKAETI
jgi:hypothetical protein